MTDVVEFPDVIDWLAGHLQTVLRANGYPDARVSDTYRGDPVEVWLQRDGGPVLDQIREVARVRVNCFRDGQTDAPVKAFAQRVSALIRVCPDGAPVVRVRQVTGPTPIADVKPRRYMMFELTVRGASLTLV